MDPLRAVLSRQLANRNDVSRRFFEREAGRLASACQEMARRFSRGGRLFAFGTGGGVTDAQHVAVEFVHPVIVGKRALPAVDISTRYCQWSVAVVKPDDIVMGFDPTDSHPGVARAIAAANGRGAQTFGLCSRAAGYAIGPIDDDPFIHQEIVEVLYHVLWETVHVFLEHTPIGHDVGAAGFLYPFLGSAPHDAIGLIPHVASSIKSKARDDERLRDAVADQAGETIVSAVRAIHQRITAGGTLLLLGNGGSATDATDWALDCIDSPKGYAPVAACSLAADAPTMSAIANDVGQESTFVRQLIALAQPNDVIIAITTSGGSANVVAALIEARKRNLLTIGLAGYDGGEIARRQLADFTIVVPSDYIPRIQEVHASVYHVMTDLLAVIRSGGIEQ
jgi:D-sedoheptulose 7-phosphate isomerase